MTLYKLVIDLEMAEPYEFYDTEVVKLPEIIQIGAVLLDDNNKQVKTFETFVKPTKSRVNDKIAQLTGISEEMLVDKPFFSEAITMLLDELPEGEDVQLCTWSDNDRRVLRKECRIKKFEDDRLSRLYENYFDIQKNLKGRLSFEKVLNLERAMDLLGLEFEGKAHGALVDAINTSKLYIAIEEDEETKQKVDTINSIMQPKEFGSSIGSLFNFSELNLE